jgi:ATP-binding cassette subfamily C (CFTR/MRP) protein 1
VTIFRGATVAIIYQKSLQTSADYNEMKAMTLMSTDVDRIFMALPQITEVWANCVQVGIGIGLLWGQLGAVAIAPIIVSVVCFGMQTQVAKVLPGITKIWVQAVQRRVGLTTTTLQLMKSIKLAGLSESMIKLLQSERIREVNLGIGVQKYVCIMNIVGT